MPTSNATTHKQRFEQTYGEGQWEKFSKLVNQETRVNAIRTRFTTTKSGLIMSKGSYYLWEARVAPSRGKKS